MSSFLFRNREYILYRAAKTVSTLGSQMSMIAYPLLVLSMGGGAARAGLVGTCVVFAQLIFELPGGYLADRFDQRRLMLGMDAVRLVAVGSIPLAMALDRLTFPYLLVEALIEGAASSVFGSAAAVFLRVMVPSDQFSRVMGQSQAATAAVGLLGPMLGGALYGVNRMLPIWADATSYAVSGILLLAVCVGSNQQIDPEPADATRTDGRVTAGLRWLWGQKSLIRVVIFCGVLNLISSITSVAAVLVLDERRTAASVIGLVMACGAVGTLAGSPLAGRANALRPTRIIMTVGLLQAGCTAAMAMSSSPWAIGIALTFLFALSPSVGLMVFQMVADEAPTDLYGRVVAAQGLAVFSLIMAGPLLAGVLVAALGGTYIWPTLAGAYALATVCAVGPSLTRRPKTAPPSLDPTVGPLRLPSRL